jgi:hypothetical protein
VALNAKKYDRVMGSIVGDSDRLLVRKGSAGDDYRITLRSPVHLALIIQDIAIIQPEERWIASIRSS